MGVAKTPSFLAKKLIWKEDSYLKPPVLIWKLYLTINRMYCINHITDTISVYIWILLGWQENLTFLLEFSIKSVGENYNSCLSNIQDLDFDKSVFLEFFACFDCIVKQIRQYDQPGIIIYWRLAETVGAAFYNYGEYGSSLWDEFYGSHGGQVEEWTDLVSAQRF